MLILAVRHRLENWIFKKYKMLKMVFWYETKSRKMLIMKWVLAEKHKNNDDESTTLFPKSRNVNMGFEQGQGVDYSEIFAFIVNY